MSGVHTELELLLDAVCRISSSLDRDEILQRSREALSSLAREAAVTIVLGPQPPPSPEQLLIPLQADDRQLGALVIDLASGRALDHDQRRVLERLANAIAAALVNAERNASLREQAELDLTAREHSLQITLDAIGEAVIAVDVDACIERMNPAAEALTGWTLAEARDRPLAEVLIIDEGASRPDARPEAVVGMTDPMLLTRSGERRHVVLDESAIRDAAGRELGAVLVVRDISERRQLEQRLRQSHKLDALGQLVGGIAHDFNNMLTGILASAELLDLSLPPDRGAEIDEGIAMILEASRRASELTGELLAFSREGHRASGSVDIHAAVEAAVTLLRSGIDRRIEVELELDAHAPRVCGDHARLQAALINLGTNARDAMAGGGRLRITTRDLELDEAECRASPFTLSPGSFVEIAVHDVGVGIDERLLPRIFEPFFTTKDRGSGLGLAAVHGTVVEHGGAIHVTSELGVGTRVVMLLPRSDALEPRAPLPPSPVTNQGPATILLVDDEPVVRRVGTLMLERLGYEVVVAADGREGVDYYAKHHAKLGLVLLDMIMPNMDGERAFEAMRNIDADVPIIVCSGYAAEESVRSMYERGLAGFMAKPYRRAQLQQIVGRVLEQRQG